MAAPPKHFGEMSAIPTGTHTFFLSHQHANLLQLGKTELVSCASVVWLHHCFVDTQCSHLSSHAVVKQGILVFTAHDGRLSGLDLETDAPSLETGTTLSDSHSSNFKLEYVEESSFLILLFPSVSK